MKPDYETPLLGEPAVVWHFSPKYFAGLGATLAALYVFSMMIHSCLLFGMDMAMITVNGSACVLLEDRECVETWLKRVDDESLIRINNHYAGCFFPSTVVVVSLTIGVFYLLLMFMKHVAPLTT